MPPRSSDDCGMGLCEYPSQLNSSALLFERAGECHRDLPTAAVPTTAAGVEVPPPAPLPPLREADGNARREKREKEETRRLQQRQQHKPQHQAEMVLPPQLHQQQDNDRCTEDGPCASSILGDDLILSRLSSLLPPAPEEFERPSQRPSLVRKISTSDVEASSSDESAESSSSSRRRRPRPAPFSLIPADAAVVLPTLLQHPDEIPSGPTSSDWSYQYRQSDDSPVQSLLRAVGIEEVEALNPTDGGPTAGQCQFACVASALSRSFGAGHPLRAGYRPDLELRRLALHVIRMNPDLYRNFLTVAGGRTRKQNGSAGASVDLASYLRAMSNPACDGDAVTLQALCDALKIGVRIVKPVDADAYDERGQRERLHRASSSAALSDEEGGAATDDEDDDDDTSSTTSASSVSSSLSALSWSNNPYSSCSRIRHVHRHHSDADAEGRKQQRSRMVRQRLYVSQEIRPRHLPRIDSRIRDVQKVARGRLIWLSHIGDEAHYRFLRPLSMASCGSSDSYRCCPYGPINEEEAAIARRSRLVRHRRLDSLCAREDGYVRPYKPTPPARGGVPDDGLGSFDVVSADKLRTLRTVAEPDRSPRCGLCFEGFFGAGSAARQPVSPSGCDHDFCRSCILTWSASVATTCPACGCHFMDLVDSNERVVRSVTPEPRDDGCCSSSSDEEEPSDEPSLAPSSAGDRPPSVRRPPPLPPTFDLDRAVEVQTNGEALAVSALNRQFLIELGRDMRDRSSGDGEGSSNTDRPAADPRILMRLLGQLSSMSNGAHLRDLLEANVLSIIRLLLTPTDGGPSAVRPTPAGPCGHVPDGEMFLAALLILEGINRRGERALLTMDMLRQSLDLPKLLLWYVSCPPLRASAEYRAGLECARGVLAGWSERHCLSIVAALQRNGAGSCSSKPVPSGPAGSRKRPSPTGRRTLSVPSPAKKRKVAAAAPPSVPATGKKRGRPLGSTKKKLKKRMARAEEADDDFPRRNPQPTVQIRRAAGKRQIRPAACVNISRDEWSRRAYRS